MKIEKNQLETRLNRKEKKMSKDLSLNLNIVFIFVEMIARHFVFFRLFSSAYASNVTL